MYIQEDHVIKTLDTPLDDSLLGGLGNFYFKYMKIHGERKAQIDAFTGQADTYNSLLQKCIRTSIALSKMGIVKGDVITYYSSIHIDACVPVIASYFMGALLTFLDINVPASEVSYLIKQVKPKLLLTDPIHLKKIKDIVKNSGIDMDIVTFDDNFFEYQKEEANFKPIYVNNLEETAAIFFSSGSTGFPKGICLSHYSLLCTKIADDICNVAKKEEENENRVTLSYDSFYWGIEPTRLISITQYGTCRLIDSQDFNAAGIWNIIEKYRVNFACLIPYDIIKMYEFGKPEGIHCRSLRAIISEGASLPKSCNMGLQQMLPDTDIFQIYGQTEAGVLTKFYNNELHRKYSRNKLESVGLPLEGSGISYRVVDLQSGKNLGPNKPGELRVKSKTVMTGYYNLDSSNQFDEEGWLKTGDVVYYDEEFCFFIVDRIKEMLVYRGWHITPALLEKELWTHPAVKEAVVVGVPHDTDGEHPLAVITLNKNADSDTLIIEIEKYINEWVCQEYTELRVEVKVVEKIPLLANGKIKRQEIKRMIRSGEI